MNQDAQIAVSAIPATYGAAILSYHYGLAGLEYGVLCVVIGIIGWIHAYKPWDRTDNDDLTEWEP